MKSLIIKISILVVTIIIIIFGTITLLNTKYGGYSYQDVYINETKKIINKYITLENSSEETAEKILILYNECLKEVAPKSYCKKIYNFLNPHTNQLKEYEIVKELYNTL